MKIILKCDLCRLFCCRRVHSGRNFFQIFLQLWEWITFKYWFAATYCFLPLFHWSFLFKNHLTWCPGKFIYFCDDQCNRAAVKIEISVRKTIIHLHQCQATTHPSPLLFAIFFHSEQVIFTKYSIQNTFGPIKFKYWRVKVCSNHALFHVLRTSAILTKIMNSNPGGKRA